jgi:hypothetical protein
MKVSASPVIAVATALAAGATLTLSACGQKGALYLPQRNGTVVGGSSVPPPAQSGPAMPAPAPQPQSAPGQTIPGTPAQPLTTPPRDAAQDPPPRNAQPGQPPKKNPDDSDSAPPQ